MSLAITDDVTIEDIDEALKHIYKMLKTDEFGNRMDWRKKELLQKSIDDLLDARISLASGEKIFDWYGLLQVFPLHGATNIPRIGQKRFIQRISDSLHDLSLQGA